MQCSREGLHPYSIFTTLQTFKGQNISEEISDCHSLLTVFPSLILPMKRTPQTITLTAPVGDTKGELFDYGLR